MTKYTFKIPQPNVNTLGERVAALIRLNELTDDILTGVDIGEETTVTVVPPTLQGLPVVAIVEPVLTDHMGPVNVVQRAPGAECPEGVLPRCDVCKRPRHRKQVFVLKRPGGSHTLVGRACLWAFNQSDPGPFARQAELLCELGELLRSARDLNWPIGRTEGGWYDLETFLAWAVSVTALDGFRPRNHNREGFEGKDRSTGESVIRLLSPSNVGGEVPWLEYDIAKYEPVSEDYDEALEVLTWAKLLAPERLEQSSVLANMNCLARSGRVDRNTAALAAAMGKRCWEEMANPWRVK